MCSLSWLLSRRSSPTATYAHARDPTLAAPHARGPLAKNCSSSCLSSLHLLRSWSLRQTRGGSDLGGVDLSMADLSGAKLNGASLFETILCKGQLRTVNLSRADLSGANLSG